MSGYISNGRKGVLVKENNEEKIYDCVKDAASANGIKIGTVYHIINNKNGKRKKQLWKYIDKDSDKFKSYQMNKTI
jgi:hypothetical protein